MQKIDDSPTIRWVGAGAVGSASAQGCHLCNYGISNALPLKMSFPLYVERRIQFDNGQIVSCECKAGQAYKRHLVEVSARNRQESVLTELNPAPAKPKSSDGKVQKWERVQP